MPVIYLLGVFQNTRKLRGSVNNADSTVDSEVGVVAIANAARGGHGLLKIGSQADAKGSSDRKSERKESNYDL